MLREREKQQLWAGEEAILITSEAGINSGLMSNGLDMAWIRLHRASKWIQSYSAFSVMHTEGQITIPRHYKKNHTDFLFLEDIQNVYTTPQ